MSKPPFVTDDPVVLEGFQAVLTPGKFGYSLTAVVDANMVSHLEEDRTEVLKWCESKLKNPKRSTLKPTPWEEIGENRFKLKFSWKEDRRPPVVDVEGTPITNEATPLYSGSKVKIAFFQKPYILKDGVTYGTSLKLVGIQVVELGGNTGSGESDYSDSDVAELFGKTDGFKASDSTADLESSTEEDDF